VRSSCRRAWAHRSPWRSSPPLSLGGAC